jgi:hypothetical protein
MLITGVFVIGPADQGILFQHEEKEFGDHADLKDILEANFLIDLPQITTVYPCYTVTIAYPQKLSKSKLKKIM